MEDDVFEPMIRHIANCRSTRRKLADVAAMLERIERPMFWAAWEVWQGKLSPHSKYYSRPRGMMEFSDLIDRIIEESDETSDLLDQRP